MGECSTASSSSYGATLCWPSCSSSSSRLTRVPDFFIQPTQRIRSSEVGDIDDKTFCFFERGRAPLRRTLCRTGAV